MRTPKMLLLFVTMLWLAIVPAPPTRDASAATPALPASASGSSRRWIVETVDSTGDVGQFASLGIQPGTGTPYISYYDASNHSLRLAYRKPTGGNCGTASAWLCSVQEPGNAIADVGRYSSLAFNLGGKPGIAYSASNSTTDLNYYDGPYPGDSLTHTFEDVDITGSYATPVASENSLKFGVDGVPRVAYELSLSGEINHVNYAQYVGSNGNCGKVGRWQCDSIGDLISSAASLDVALSGRPSIAYAGDLGVLRFASFVNSGGNCGPSNSWTCNTIAPDPGAYIDFPSLYVPKCLFSCTIRTQIAYQDVDSSVPAVGNLKYARYVQAGGNCGSSNSWQCDTIDNMGRTNAAGQRVALAVDGAGTPLIAYQDSNDQSNAILKVARFVGYGGNCGPTVGQFAVHTWQCDVVDNGLRIVLGASIYHNVGNHVSVALNSAGLATIAYYDATSGLFDKSFKKLQGCAG